MIKADRRKFGKIFRKVLESVSRSKIHKLFFILTFLPEKPLIILGPREKFTNWMSIIRVERRRWQTWNMIIPSQVCR